MERTLFRIRALWLLIAASALLPLEAPARSLSEELRELRSILSQLESPSEALFASQVDPETISLGASESLVRIPGEHAYIGRAHALASHSPETIAKIFASAGLSLEEHHFFEAYRCGKALNAILVIRKDRLSELLPSLPLECTGNLERKRILNPKLFPDFVQKGQSFLSFRQASSSEIEQVAGRIASVEESSCATRFATDSKAGSALLFQDADNNVKIGAIAECRRENSFLSTSTLLEAELHPIDPSQFKTLREKHKSCFPEDLGESDARGGGG